jgi:hypothetical protein
MDVYEKHIGVLKDTLATYLECLAKINIEDFKRDKDPVIDRLKRIDQTINRLKEEVDTFKNSTNNNTLRKDYLFEKKCDKIQNNMLPLVLLQCMNNLT